LEVNEEKFRAELIVEKVTRSQGVFNALKTMDIARRKADKNGIDII